MQTVHKIDIQYVYYNFVRRGWRLEKKIPKSLPGGNNNNYKKLRSFPDGPVVRLPVSSAGRTDLIPDQGTKIPHTVQHSQKKKKMKLCHLQRDG